MTIFIKLAWRNSFRNKRRTTLSALAIGVGLSAMIFTDALLIGWKNQMIRTTTSTYLGEAQIHHKEYKETMETEKTIPNFSEISKKLSNSPNVKKWTARTTAFAMASSAANVHSISIAGINPKTEQNISKIDESILKGKYLDDSEGNSILIGQKLAEILEVTVGDKIVITVAMVETGDMSQEMFRVGGIFHFGIREMDRGIAFIGLKKSQKLLGLDNKVNEIAMTFNQNSIEIINNSPLWKELKKEESYVAETWMELQPELSTVLEMLDFSMLILGIILFLIVAADIINTLFMSLYERMYEFGIMRAVGTRPSQMLKLVILEAGALAIISSIIGIIIGAIITLYFQKHGIDYSGTEFANVAMEAVYPVIRVQQFILYPICVIFFTMITGIYPALFAARMKVSKTLKEQF